jgi:hypothetical protein
MNPNLEYLIKHPIKTAVTTGAGIFLFTNITNAQESLGDYNKTGKVISTQTRQPIQGIEVTMPIFDGATPIDTLGPLYTNSNGIYSTIISDVGNPQTSTTQSTITYIGNKILTEDINDKTLKIYVLETGEEIRSINTNNSEININLEGLATGRYLTILETKKGIYANALINNARTVIGYQKVSDAIKTTDNNKLDKKLENLILTREFKDPNGQYHAYIRGVIDPTYYENTTFNIALPQITFLPDSMQFNSPRGTYPINTEIRLWQHMANVVDPDTYKSIGRKLMPMKVYLDTLNTPTGWKDALRNGINNIRNQTTHHPDSLVQETSEYRELQFENGFSQINVSYVDSTITGEWDYLITFRYDNDNDTFVGATLEIDTSRGQQPIDVYKAIQRNIQKYIVGTPHPIDNPKYMGTDTRGEPYNITTPEMNLIDMTRTFQDIIVQNNGQRIFINRFLHPGEGDNNSKLYIPETPNGYERKGSLFVPKAQIKETDPMYIEKQEGEKSTRVVIH